MATAAGTSEHRNLPPAAAPGASGEEAPAPTKARAKRPRIDYDESIAQARAAMVRAQKDVADARRVARNERRKKQRLVKKAAALSPDDLERIAVLKRCGLRVASTQVQAPSVEQAATGGSAGSGLNGASGPEPGPTESDDDRTSDRASEPSSRGLADELDRS